MEGYARPELLAEPDWLWDHHDDPNVRIIDCDSAEAYRRAHIPGAVRRCAPPGDSLHHLGSMNRRRSDASHCPQCSTGGFHVLGCLTIMARTVEPAPAGGSGCERDLR